ncbi:MAG: response regulator [Sporomusaceae bacterium]|jgi:CheY-like chemotaxis protein|nr:response regulator [Sporomusaceae bacterium]
MDHMMPDMDGVEATRIIREEIGTDYARQVPIIALTANAIVGNKEMFLKNGFQDFISKPIDLLKLDVILRRWVRDKNLEKELLAETESNNSNATAKEKSLLAGVTLKSIDKDKALDRFDGDETVFIGILRSYAKNTRTILNNLLNSLATGNLEEYAIAIHGIKGSSYAILAQKAGKMAEELEAAAKAENLAAVQAGHAIFHELAQMLLSEIDQALLEIDASTNSAAAQNNIVPIEQAAADLPVLKEKKAVAAPELIALLKKLAAAMDNFDLDGADRAFGQLEKIEFPPECRAYMERLRVYVHDVAMAEVLELTEVMIKIIENIPENGE